MASPIITGVLQDGEKLMKYIAMKNQLAEVIKTWLNDDPTKTVDEGLEMLDTYIGDDTYELMAQSAMNILLAQKSLTEYHRNEGVEGI